MSELYELSLSEAAEALQKRAISALELTRACLARIQATEPLLNACVSLRDEEALAEAGRLDAAGPDPAKALWGVPVSLKDLICLRGSATTCASNMLKNFVPPYDAEVAARLKAAGAIIVAKANMDEFAMGSSTETSAFGITRNPWGLERIPGGSSGGSAASVAAGQVFASLGSDTGGSIRQPASMCGCVGIKPTYGRVSRYGVVAYGSSFDQVGPLARTVEDGARVLRAIAGFDAKEATSAIAPVDDYPAFALDGGLKGRNGDLRGLRIGLPEEFWSAGLSPEVENTCRKLLKRAKEAGAELAPVSLPHQRYGIAVYYIMASAEASTNLARFDGVRYGFRTREPKDLLDLYTASRSKGFGEEVQRRIMLGAFVLSSGYYDAYFRKAAQVRRLLRADFDAALERCDVLAAPVSPVTAWEFGRFKASPLEGYKMDLLTVTLNLAGLPGIALPAGLGAESGLPVGLQIMGRPFAESGMIRAAAGLEALADRLGPPAGIK